MATTQPLIIQRSAMSPQPLPRKGGDLNGRSVEDLKGRLGEIENHHCITQIQQLDALSPEYKDVFTPGVIATRVIIISVVVAGCAALILLMGGHLTHLPQNFMNWIHTVNPIDLAIGIGTTVAILTVTGAIIYRAATKKDPLLDTSRGAFGVMDEHLEVAYVAFTKHGKTHDLELYVDTSTLDDNKSGKAYLYRVKDPADHYNISVIATLLGIPAELIGAVAYNALRMVAVFGYVLVQLIRECGGKQLYQNERQFEVIDLFVQPALSLFRIVKAPFYALALFMTGLYSLVNPMGGRKLAAAVAQDWNEGVNLIEGYWSVDGWQELGKWEGGGGPYGLGRNGFYIAGCWQPVGIVEFVNGNIKRDENGVGCAYYLAKAIDKESEAAVNYKVTTRKSLKYFIEKNKKTIQNLQREHQEILRELQKRGS